MSADATWPQLVRPSWIGDSSTTNIVAAAAPSSVRPSIPRGQSARTMTTHGQGERSPSPPPPSQSLSFRTRGGGNDTALMLPDFGEMMARGPSEVYRCPSSSMYNVTSCSQSIIFEISERTGAFSLCGTVPLPDFTLGGATNEGGRNNATSNDNSVLGGMSNSRTGRDPIRPRRPCHPQRVSRARPSPPPTTTAMSTITTTRTRPSCRCYRISIRSSTTYDPTTPPSSRCGRCRSRGGQRKTMTMF
jgi:hypothetical protein